MIRRKAKVVMTTGDVKQIVLAVLVAARVQLEDRLADRVTARLEREMYSLLPAGGSR